MTICYKKPRPIGPSMTPGRRGFDAGPNGWATRWVMRAQGKNSRCPRYSHYYSIHYLVGGSLYPSEIIRNLYFGQENAGRMSSLSNQSILPHTIPKHWLVVVYTPLKNMSSSVGIMKFPTEWKNIIHVPNHQADNEFWALLTGSTGFYISLARVHPRCFAASNPQSSGAAPWASMLSARWLRDEEAWHWKQTWFVPGNQTGPCKIPYE